MAVRQRRRTTDATQNISAAVGEVFACGAFFANKLPLPSEKGAQLSMTGEVTAIGNSGDFRDDALLHTLHNLPALWHTSEKELRRFVLRKHFLLLCEDCDRAVALLGIIAEMTRYGIMKIVIAADTPTERDTIAQSLELMRASLGNTAVTTYRTKHYTAASHYKAYASIYGYLTSTKPEILILSRDAFSRQCNILRRANIETEDRCHALSDLIRAVKPVVITCSETIAGGRTIARNAAIFDPIATLIITGEEKRLRDCVIYKPERTVKKKKETSGIPEQIGF